MTVNEIAGIAVAATAGVGVWLVVAGLAPRRDLARRLAPWLADVSVPAANYLNQTTKSQATPVGNRLVRLLARWLARVWTPSRQFAVLTRQAGLTITAEHWRIRLVEVGMTGALGGALVGVVAVVCTSTPWTALIGAVVLGAAAGVFLRRRALTRSAARRVSLMRAEIPVVADLLALAVTAGESFVAALERVSEHGSGPLADELRVVARAVHHGVSAVDALTAMTSSLAVPEISRTFDHVISALERGAPVAASLRVQAQEARAESARVMIERAASREVIMLVPLIFLILPVTIAFTKVQLRI